MQAVGGEQDGVSGRELNGMLIVGCGSQQAGRQSALSESLALGGGCVEGKRESGVGKGQTAGGRVKGRVQRRAKVAGKRTLHQTPVQKRKDGGGIGPGFECREEYP